MITCTDCDVKIRYMTKQNAIKIFEDRKVRSVWDAEAEKWYISIVDAVGNPLKSGGERVDYKL